MNRFDLPMKSVLWAGLLLLVFGLGMIQAESQCKYNGPSYHQLHARMMKANWPASLNVSVAPHIEGLCMNTSYRGKVETVCIRTDEFVH